MDAAGKSDPFVKAGVIGLDDPKKTKQVLKVINIVNVICKYQFIMYYIDQPDILYPDISL